MFWKRRKPSVNTAKPGCCCVTRTGAVTHAMSRVTHLSSSCHLGLMPRPPALVTWDWAHTGGHCHSPSIDTLQLELETKAIRRFAKISQSRRKALQVRSPGWKRLLRLLALSHLKHLTQRSLGPGGFVSIVSYSHPSRGLLRDCEIFANLRITFVSSSNIVPCVRWAAREWCTGGRGSAPSVPRARSGCSSTTPTLAPGQQNTAFKKGFEVLILLIALQYSKILIIKTQFRD